MNLEPELCRVADSLSILVGKWKPIILLHLLKNGTQRFSELKRRMPRITQKMLTNQLRELESEDILSVLSIHRFLLKWNIRLLNTAGAWNQSYTQCMNGAQSIHCIKHKKTNKKASK